MQVLEFLSRPSVPFSRGRPLDLCLQSRPLLATELLVPPLSRTERAATALTCSRNSILGGHSIFNEATYLNAPTIVPAWYHIHNSTLMANDVVYAKIGMKNIRSTKFEVTTIITEKLEHISQEDTFEHPWHQNIPQAQQCKPFSGQHCSRP